jgi:hypothetical protein
MHTDEFRLNPLSEHIIGCALKVRNALGSGFSGKGLREGSSVCHECRHPTPANQTDHPVDLSACICVHRRFQNSMQRMMAREAMPVGR